MYEVKYIKILKTRMSLKIFPRKLLIILLQTKHKDRMSEETRLMMYRLNDNMTLDEKKKPINRWTVESVSRDYANVI